MKKLVYTTVLVLIASIVTCFATDHWMAGYSLIFLLVSILTGIGHIYSADNSIYLQKSQKVDDDDYRKYME
ncbi:hypothetical protein ACTID9_22340 [Brevibacillus fluminis]|uniref:hypothetical protein n=1 Tax=Brevibacillus fluminis TaxID=511487 RepID=UPI003F89EB46